MKLTLRAARKLESKIQNKISEGVDYDVTFSPYETTPVSEKFALAEQNMRGDVEDILCLSEIRYDIRRQIQQLNEESGINEMVNKRKLMLDCLAHWKDIKKVAERTHEPVSVEVIEGKLEAIRNSTDKSSYSFRDTVTVPVVSDSFAGESEKAIRNLEMSIEELDDNILSKNMGTKVTLSDIDATFLRSKSLLSFGE